MDEKIEIWADELVKDSFMSPEDFSSALFKIMYNDDSTK